MTQNSSQLDLHSACRAGDLSLIKIAHFTDPSKLNEKDASLGWCPLYRSVICGHYEAALYLLQQGADPNISNNLGETPLHQASDNSQYSLAQILLEYKADPNSQQKDGDTPLHHAAFRGDCKMAVLLMESGADPNIANFMFGRTPLHYAVDCGQLECVKAMLDREADPFIRDKQGKNAFELSTSSEVLQVLKDSVEIIQESNEISPIGEVTTYIVSEIGEDRTPKSFETFGMEHQSEFNKQSIVSPISEKSRENFMLHPIYAWLEKHKLESCYEALVDTGYYSTDVMLRQMNGPMPISEKNLKDFGIRKPGHRRRLLIKLEEESGMSGKIVGRRDEDNEVCLKCCSGGETRQLVKEFSLFDWLEQLGLSHLHDNFLEAGYDTYEALIEVQGSLHPFNIRVLEQELSINSIEERMLILKSLQEDLVRAERKRMIGQNARLGCDTCEIF